MHKLKELLPSLSVNGDKGELFAARPKRLTMSYTAFGTPSSRAPLAPQDERVDAFLSQYTFCHSFQTRGYPFPMPRRDYQPYTAAA